MTKPVYPTEGNTFVRQYYPCKACSTRGCPECYWRGYTTTKPVEKVQEPDEKSNADHRSDIDNP